ncbi:MAG: hypothetical protein KTR31_36875 [Myxococcales bacterium]|nr:hypothetical protein [Myxococcales bacterium]
MAFKMRCPKCEGLDYSIERDNRTFGAVAQAFELVYHCRCGKQMFGEQLLKEYDRQKKEYDASAPLDAADTGLAAAMRAQEESGLAGGVDLDRMIGERNVHVVDPSRRREEEDRRWRAKVQEASQHVSPSIVTPVREARGGSTGSDQECAWPGCEKTRRPNSKYCSRACSNKNARARHKARQKKAKKAKPASL